MKETRNGKIARLPRAIREQLNRRLADGEVGKKLVVWLNSLPEVVTVLAAEFAAHSVTAQNLSEWRKGGYREWLTEQQAREALNEMVAEGAELKDRFGDLATDKLASWLLPYYMGARARCWRWDKNPENAGRCYGRFARTWWRFAGVIILSNGCVWKASGWKPREN